MGFFKKLFTGIGFAAGFLFFGCLSVIVYGSRILYWKWSKD